MSGRVVRGQEGRKARSLRSGSYEVPDWTFLIGPHIINCAKKETGFRTPRNSVGSRHDLPSHCASRWRMDAVWAHFPDLGS